MSAETNNPSDENQRPPQQISEGQQPPLPEESGPEPELNFDPEQQGEVESDEARDDYSLEETDIASNGLMSRAVARIVNPHMSESRAERKIRKAEETVEKMDHKDALYSGLGKIAMSPDPLSEEKQHPKAKTLPERMTSVIIDHRTRKKIYADNNAHRTKRISGPDKSKPVASIRKTVYDRTTGLVTESAGGAEPRIIRNMYDNGERIVVGPDIPGKTKLKRLLDRSINRFEFLTGGKSARAARVESDKIKSADGKLGDKKYKQTRRQARRRDESFDLAVDQPLRSAWRNSKRNRALKRIDRIRSHLDHQVTERENVEKAQTDKIERLQHESELLHDELGASGLDRLKHPVKNTRLALTLLKRINRGEYNPDLHPKRNKSKKRASPFDDE